MVAFEYFTRESVRVRVISLKGSVETSRYKKCFLTKKCDVSVSISKPLGTESEAGLLNLTGRQKLD